MAKYGDTRNVGDVRFFGSEDRIPTELVDYRYLITQQIWRCQSMLTVSNNLQHEEQTEQAIDVLENMLLACADNTNKYAKKMDELNKKHAEDLKKLNDKEKKEQKQKRLHSYLLSKWRILLELASSMGFTYMKKKTVEIK